MTDQQGQPDRRGRFRPQHRERLAWAASSRSRRWTAWTWRPCTAWTRWRGTSAGYRCSIRSNDRRHPVAPRQGSGRAPPSVGQRRRQRLSLRRTPRGDSTGDLSHLTFLEDQWRDHVGSVTRGRRGPTSGPAPIRLRPSGEYAEREGFDPGEIIEFTDRGFSGLIRFEQRPGGGKLFDFMRCGDRLIVTEPGQALPRPGRPAPHPGRARRGRPHAACPGAARSGGARSTWAPSRRSRTG